MLVPVQRAVTDKLGMNVECLGCSGAQGFLVQSEVLLPKFCRFLTEPSNYDLFPLRYSILWRYRDDLLHMGDQLSDDYARMHQACLLRDT